MWIIEEMARIIQRLLVVIMVQRLVEIGVGRILLNWGLVVL
jgi:hypothetical protein